MLVYTVSVTVIQLVLALSRILYNVSSAPLLTIANFHSWEVQIFLLEFISSKFQLIQLIVSLLVQALSIVV